jgi:hypothetical protein
MEKARRQLLVNRSARDLRLQAMQNLLDEGNAFAPASLAKDEDYASFLPATMQARADEPFLADSLRMATNSHLPSDRSDMLCLSRT